MKFIAHSRNTRGQRHDLEAHLRSVADLAAGFAAAFDASDLARLLGLWHDLGKYNPVFQQYLLDCEADPTHRGHGPDHKAAGAQLTRRYLPPAATVIQAHHGGLKAPNDFRDWLVERSKDPAIADSLRLARQAIPDLEPAKPPALPSHILHDPLAAEFFLRMIFSALVDADYLDTEQHFSAHLSPKRGATVSMDTLWERFGAYRKTKGMDIPRTDAVGAVRHAVYDACLAAATLPPGLFRLAVPTGGGKTLSAMAFALQHARQHDLRRIIVAVPFISITEQTAQTYREAFERTDQPDTVVLEHHSGATVDQKSNPGAMWARLAAENWDAPIIVTTTVQLFESLFANGTSPSRKNHRLARSIIILDEAQAFPARLLSPILDALQELCRHYGTTVIMSTATQPAFEEIPAFARLTTRDIVPDAARHFELLRRVEYEWWTDREVPWAEIAALMRAQGSALTIVNTKRDALTLLDALDDPDALHLSTLLCGAHRRAVIADVKRRLQQGKPCLLVATQVVEAGVDIDFPLVLRALGPLDSMIQAAGRCNREGLLQQGRVIVFRSEGDHMPPGFYRIATNITSTMLGAAQGHLDLDKPDVIRTYFQLLYHDVDTDAEGIQTLRSRLDYPKTAELFRIIEDDAESVVVSYGSDDERKEVQRSLDRLRNDDPQARLLLRRLQPYMVSVRTREAEHFKRRGRISPVCPGVSEWLGAYDAVRGLTDADLKADVLVV